MQVNGKLRGTVVMAADLDDETVLSNVDNEDVIASVRHRVNETMKAYPIFAY